MCNFALEISKEILLKIMKKNLLLLLTVVLALMAASCTTSIDDNPDVPESAYRATLRSLNWG